MDLEIHYLSATVVSATNGQTRHLSFCKQLFDYERDRQRYQVANYSMPTRVDCYDCLAAYAETYPDRWAEYLKFANGQAGVNPWRDARYPAPIAYTPPSGEPAMVQAYRACIAQYEREWLAKYVADETIPTVDLMAAFTQISYRNARNLARLALRAHKASDESRKG